MTSEPSSVIDMLPGPVWTALADGRIDCVDRGWHAYSSMDTGLACGEGWLACTRPEDPPVLRGHRRSIAASGKAGGALQHFDTATRSNNGPKATSWLSPPCRREPARQPGAEADDARVRATKDC